MKGVNIDEENMTILRDVALSIGKAVGKHPEWVLEQLILSLRRDTIFKQIYGGTMDKRKMIEKALGSCKEYPFKRHCLLDEPDQPIAIECEIIQGAKLVSKAPVTEIHLDPDGLDEYSETYIILPGHPLPEGKALAIIIPLEEE